MSSSSPPPPWRPLSLPIPPPPLNGDLGPSYPHPQSHAQYAQVPSRLHNHNLQWHFRLTAMAARVTLPHSHGDLPTLTTTQPASRLQAHSGSHDESQPGHSMKTQRLTPPPTRSELQQGDTHSHTHSGWVFLHRETHMHTFIHTLTCTFMCCHTHTLIHAVTCQHEPARTHTHTSRRYSCTQITVPRNTEMSVDSLSHMGRCR